MKGNKKWTKAETKNERRNWKKSRSKQNNFDQQEERRTNERVYVRQKKKIIRERKKGEEMKWKER